MRLLLIEDNEDLARSLCRFLSLQGHAVDHVRELASAEAALRTGDFACVLLDLGLPDGSGLQILREMRARQDRTPVIITTALEQIRDRIAGLDAGADDYLVKPFDLQEIAARIRANARRGQGVPETRIQIGDLQIDRSAARVWRDAKEIRLTSREWALLDALLGARGRVLSKDMLENALYAFDAEIEGNAVEVYISRLRQKIGAEQILTRRGLGYLLP